MSTSKVQFIQYHRPAMESGLYHVRVEQTISSSDGEVPATPYSREIQFAVTGARFAALTPADVDSVFPPPGSSGDHDNVLPHISLVSSTLPWERTPDGNVDSKLPWLALLILHDSDFSSPAARPRLQTLSLGKLQQGHGGGTFPPFELEPGQHAEDLVQVIDVERGVLQQALPDKPELGYLAHVRQGKDGTDKATGPELATVIANRLPQQNGFSTAYLVSVENRFEPHGNGFQWLGAGDSDLVRLVCLESWRFACVDPSQSFTNLILDLKRSPGTLRLADTSSHAANTHLGKGRVPLPHHLRDGDHTVSWYHGPLVPGRPAVPLNLPVRASDELLSYDPSSGLFDTSYAAAWQLGRLLMLHSKKTAVDLYQWKRATAQALKHDEHEVEHLPLEGSLSNTEVPAGVVEFFRQASLLKDVPFDYLVPDERLLPVESIRFFQVDPLWIESMLDGAFSIGRVTTSDHSQDVSHPIATPYGNLSGFLLRSTLVSGWPGSHFDGYATRLNNEGLVPAGESPLEILRLEKLSSNVLLCLFEGDVQTLEFYLKPETMHFGVDAPTGDPATFHKTLRNIETGSDEGQPFVVPWKGAEHDRVVSIDSLVTTMRSQLSAPSFTSALFALQMISGAQKVRFTISG